MDRISRIPRREGCRPGGGVSLLQVLACDGCGARAEMGTAAGWRVFSINPLSGAPNRGADPVAVCPGCWGSKTCAEVLGETYSFLAAR